MWHSDHWWQWWWQWRRTMTATTAILLTPRRFDKVLIIATVQFLPLSSHHYFPYLIRSSIIHTPSPNHCLQLFCSIHLGGTRSLPVRRQQITSFSNAWLDGCSSCEWNEWHAARCPGGGNSLGDELKAAHSSKPCHDTGTFKKVCFVAQSGVISILS